MPLECDALSPCIKGFFHWHVVSDSMFDSNSYSFLSISLWIPTHPTYRLFEREMHVGVSTN
jgi:hypothetical protein